MLTDALNKYYSAFHCVILKNPQARFSERGNSIKLLDEENKKIKIGCWGAMIYVLF